MEREDGTNFGGSDRFLVRSYTVLFDALLDSESNQRFEIKRSSQAERVRDDKSIRRQNTRSRCTSR